MSSFIVKSNSPMQMNTSAGDYLACCGKQYIPFTEQSISEIDWTTKIRIKELRKIVNAPEDGVVSEESRLIVINKNYAKYLLGEERRHNPDEPNFSDMKKEYEELSGEKFKIGTSKKKLIELLLELNASK